MNYYILGKDIVFILLNINENKYYLGSIIFIIYFNIYLFKLLLYTRKDIVFILLNINENKYYLGI